MIKCGKSFCFLKNHAESSKPEDLTAEMYDNLTSNIFIVIASQKVSSRKESLPSISDSSCLERRHTFKK